MSNRARRRGRGARGARGTRGARGPPVGILDNGAEPAAEDLECAVCCGLLVEPALLPCGHRFCCGCVKSTAAAGAAACPLCRRRVGAWLRRAEAADELIERPLWDYIRERFPDRLAAKPQSQSSQDQVARKLSQPGEIRSEYEAELNRIREERRLQEQKYSKDTENLIRELQERERLENEARNRDIVEADEKYARELSTKSDSTEELPLAPPTVATPRDNRTKGFYTDLERRTNGYKTKTLDDYLNKTNESIEDRKKDTSISCNSPELISTAGRCGRFIRNFFHGKLWSSNESTKTNDSSKIEPKIWEPERASVGQEQELSVNSGIVTQRKSMVTLGKPKDAGKTKIDLLKFEADAGSEDSLAQELCYFKPIQPIPITRYSGKLIRSLAIKKSHTDMNLKNERTMDKHRASEALEKLRGSKISQSQIDSAFVCLLTVPLSCIKVLAESSSTDSPRKDKKSKSVRTPKKLGDKRTISDADNGLNGCNSDQNVETQVKSDTSERTIRNGSIHKSQTADNLRCKYFTPKKASPRKMKGGGKYSQSCTKLDMKDVNIRSRASARLKRSISFSNELNSLNNNSHDTNDINLSNSYDQLSCENNAIDAKNNGVYCVEKNFNNRTLRSNGNLGKSNGFLKMNVDPKKAVPSPEKVNGNKNGKYVELECKEIYDSVDVVLNTGADITLNKLDSSIIDEQKRIEEMIAQEKKDLALAKKLQRQMGGNSIFTGYTVRTAAKRQATITELLPPNKKMRI